MNVGFISLGCSKNLVDTEMMIGLFNKNGYYIVNNPEEAEIIVINTCGFIETAKKEAIDTILEMAEYKNNKCKYLIVTGCLVERYKEELKKEIPEVDLFISIKEYSDIWGKISNLISNEKCKEYGYLNYMDRVITTGKNYAYLKIAEGCSNNCTYCAIPSIRGIYISRKMEDIIEEAKELYNNGIRELIVIAQDTTKYGIDIYGESKLSELLEKLCNIDFKWIRFLYSYPESIKDELIEVVKNNEKICNYFDIPIQHISDKVLKRMGRKSTSDTIKHIIKKIRREIPNVVLRTSLIVGFPGETKEDFKELKDFVQDVKFDRLGVFTYSKEDGTPAVKLKGHIKEDIKKERYNEIMSIQKEIVKSNNSNIIGKNLECYIFDITDNNEYYIGRSYMDVPSIDGNIYVKVQNETEDSDIRIGEYVDAIITDVMGYDLIAEICTKMSYK